MIVQETKTKAFSNQQQEVIEACFQAKKLEDSGEYERAAEVLGDLWNGIGEKPNLENFSREMQAEVLVRIGALTGWLGSSRQIVGFQEKAKDLIGEGVRIFEDLGESKKAAEAQSDLGICYWREGANSEAQHYLEDALSKLPSQDTALHGKILLRMVNVAISTHRYRDALSLLKKAVPYIEKFGDDLLLGKLYFHFALVFRRITDEKVNSLFFKKALQNYQKAIYHYEKANHQTYCAMVENNLGFLLLLINEHKKAHQHLDNAIKRFGNLNDAGRTALAFDTKAQVFLAEEKLIEAEVFAQKSVQLLQDGDEHSSLSESLTTLGKVYARQESFADAKQAFEKAIEEAVYVGNTENAALIKLVQIEELQSVLSEEEKTTLYKEANETLSDSENPKTRKRLKKAAKTCLEDEEEFDWKNFNLPDEVKKCEAKFIEKALLETKGSVTKAAKLLGISHQNLSLLLKNRHKDLAYAKKPRRRRSDRKKPKSK